MFNDMGGNNPFKICDSKDKLDIGMFSVSE